MNDLKVIEGEKGSYGQILRSATIIGGSQLINIAIGIIRTKFFAVLLGPVGVGLLGIFNSLIQLVVTISSLGIGSSAVKEVAIASSSNDQTKISRSILTVRIFSFFLGLLGMFLTIILSSVLSQVSFGTKEHNLNIAFLSVIIFFAVIAMGQTAILQAFRRVKDVAFLNIFGSLLGTICSVPMIFLWRQKAVVPFLITTSLINLILSWLYARKIKIARISLKLSEIIFEARGLLTLGLAFMGSSLITQGVSYLIRIILIRRIGLEGIGLYQAAFTLSSIYVGVILTAMGLDYFPRLAAVAYKNPECNQLINQQTEVGLLIAVPGIVTTLIFAPFILNIFYSEQFVGAYGILRWAIIGVLLRVLSWPIGYLVIAKGKAMLFFITELLSNLMHLVFIWLFTNMFGIIGTGVSFCCFYIFYTILIYFIGHHLSRFVWTANNLRLMLLISIVTILSFFASDYLSDIYLLIVGIIISIGAGYACIKRLYILVGKEWFASMLKGTIKIFEKARLRT